MPDRTGALIRVKSVEAPSLSRSGLRGVIGTLSKFRLDAAFALVAVQLSAAAVSQQAALTLSDSTVLLTWEKSPQGWVVHDVAALDSRTRAPLSLGRVSGRYTVLFSDAAPGSKSIG